MSSIIDIRYRHCHSDMQIKELGMNLFFCLFTTARGHKKQSEVHDNRNPRSTHLTELDIMQIEPEQEEMGVVYVDDDESKGETFNHRLYRVS